MNRNASMLYETMYAEIVLFCSSAKSAEELSERQEFRNIDVGFIPTNLPTVCANERTSYGDTVCVCRR